jgi:glycosyltransferase involved in cell wall biosynthesis
VLEACAAGTPTLASDIPGVDELAARFPTVACLPLAADDRAWAATAEALRATDGPELRAAAIRRFAASAFTIDDCARAHCRVWRGEPVA